MWTSITRRGYMTLDRSMRFYVQFKRLMGTTPGTYVQVKKRQDNELNNQL